MIVATTTPHDELPLLPSEWDEAVKRVMGWNLPIRETTFRLEIAWAYAYNGFEAATRFVEARKREEHQRRGPTADQHVLR